MSLTPTQIGPEPFDRAAMLADVPAFLQAIAQRPFADNAGGMGLPHLFATWHMLRQLQPKVVIESGVWRGMGTWLIEQAVPAAQVFSIDINLTRRIYISPWATYLGQDFAKQTWQAVPDKARAVLFFDDHQNAVARIHQMRQMGFVHAIFEDNYPAGYGDCYSLKKAFANAGHQPTYATLKDRLVALWKGWHRPVAPNTQDSALLHQVLDGYYEFPPVVLPPLTRWGQPWATYGTPAPLMADAAQPEAQPFLADAATYTWMCYARLKTS